MRDGKKHKARTQVKHALMHVQAKLNASVLDSALANIAPVCSVSHTGVIRMLSKHSQTNHALQWLAKTSAHRSRTHKIPFYLALSNEIENAYAYKGQNVERKHKLYKQAQAQKRIVNHVSNL
jgi:ribosomal protein S7